MTVKSLITQIKNTEDDFEFYPSTKEMVQIVSNSIKAETSWRHDGRLNCLDVGCGNGNALDLIQDCMCNTFDEYGYPANTNVNINKFGIEKSKKLIQNMGKEIVIIGCDFECNTLIDKKMDYIFCNPPYSKYEAWACKLIKESNCKHLYLIIPQRWKESQSILSEIKRRRENTEAVILGSFNFMDSEYRKARARVDVLKIDLTSRIKDSPFDIWFDDQFKLKKAEDEIEFPEDAKKKSEEDLVNGQNLIERIVELYQNEMTALLENYKNLQAIPFFLLKELGVDKETIKLGLEQKIKGLKDKYWHELFNNLDKITSRLTTKYRKKILAKLLSTTSIDVNIDNMYSVVIWVVKNANIYQDEQLLDVYKSMTEPKNIELYKSNIHFIADSWRGTFLKEVSKYKLEYRLVLSCNVSPGYYSFNNRNGISETGYDFINDIFTIAKTLGLKIQKSNGLNVVRWTMGKQTTFYCEDGSVFAEMRPYKNGNLHAKFNKNFILRLNIEAGKLNGWIKDPKHASQEMDIPEKEIIRFFNTHKKIDLNNPHDLLEAPEEETALPFQMDLFDQVG